MDAGFAAYPGVLPTILGACALRTCLALLAILVGEQESVIEGKLVSEWVVILRDGAPQARKNAAWALRQDGRLPKSATAALASALSDPDTYVREEVAKALAHQGPPLEAVPQLRKALIPHSQGDYNQVGGCTPCYEAAVALLRLGPKAVPTLVDALADPKTSHVEVAYVLGQIGPPAAAALPLLEGLAMDKDPMVRDSAKKAAQQIRRK